MVGFFYTLDRQLEDVDTFYNRKYGEFSRRMRLLYDRYGMISKLSGAMEKDEMDDLLSTLLELRGQYRKLQWYGEVNRRGFVKITKKLNKKIPSSTAQSRYLTTKVDPKQFASNNKLTLDMRSINQWLQDLNDSKVPSDDTDSVHSASSGSLRRIASKSALKIPSSDVEAMDQAVKENNMKKLEDLFASLPGHAGGESLKSLKLDLLQRSIHHRSYDCIVGLLPQVSAIDQEEDMNKRNCLHRLVISIGRSRALQLSGGLEGLQKGSSYINAAQPPVRAPGTLKVEERDPSDTQTKDEPAEQLLDFVLRHLTAEQKRGILTKDVYGRMPLHYAAEYGLVAVSLMLMEYMHQWQLFDVGDGLDAPTWQDSEGYAPFHLAVISGHYRTAKALLLVEASDNFKDIPLSSKHVEKSGASLALATKANYYKIVQLLVDVGVDINHQDAQGETALHIAARFGYEACAKALLAGSEGQKIDMELAEKNYGWTPVFTACVDGKLEIVKLLQAHGAQINKPDFSGWTPQEHAALRGHLDIAHFISALLPAPSLQPSPPLAPQETAARIKAGSLEGRRSNGVPAANGQQPPRVPEPVKSFGHRYLQEDSMVLVSLGTLDERKALDKPPVTLENIELTDAHATQLDTALSLVVSSHGAIGEPVMIDLPIQENISTSPVTFTAKDPSKMKIYFDLVPTYAGTTDKVIGRAVALLSTIKPSIGSQRMNLQGDLSVPLLSRDTLEVIGSVSFNFLIITPFKHPNMSISEDRTYWKKSSTMVIGHRGMGKNLNPQSSKTSLQLGENTIQSFVTAANLGASYVEFDVQMTKDHVPVIYHDFLVSETGADIPVHTLTLEQFLALGDGGSTRPSRPASPAPPDNAGNEGKRRAQRSYSAGAREDELRLQDRMRFTRTWKEQNFKANIRGTTIQAPFTTLEEMFKKLPEDVGFNIEMKYPMLFESEEQGMDTYAVELNSFVDIVLKQVYDLGGKKRNIIFSSFHPDICLLLSFKQPSIPVLFLTDAGTSEVGDIRASSLQEAVRFASRWNLLGIVSASEPFVMCPRLIQVVKNSGLVCFSYGVLNNDAHNSKLQAQEGIDAVIVDNVARVRKGLTGPDQTGTHGVNTPLMEPQTANTTVPNGVPGIEKAMNGGLKLGP